MIENSISPILKTTFRKIKIDFNTFVTQKSEMIKNYLHSQLEAPVGNLESQDCIVTRFGRS